MGLLIQGVRAAFLLASALTAATIATSQPGDSQPTSDTILQICVGEKAELDVACDAYLGGIYEGLLAGQLSSTELTTFCAPDPGIGSREVRQALLELVEDAPEIGSIAPGMAVLIALESAYPCTDRDDLSDRDSSAFLDALV